ncbi:hypothetical protein OH76DRAFT_246553 [Lentinus brumalis]|uniref:Uncharacterized protein n=1 Tax=Lentinus brumalis TaxID=2498619 RepID=A0A371CLV0_9APHY|nr:hypothetical protein OH76DRAFT_246553 [Polyporus brumalis]
MPQHRADPAYWEGDQYLLEIVREEPSDPEKPRMRYSDAALAAQKAKWQRLIANSPPRMTITPRLLASSGTNPPILLYGWPYKKNHFVD